MNAKEVIEVLVYWDTQGEPEDWAERVTYSDGSQDSGPCSWDPTCLDDLPTSVVEAAAVYGVTISPDEVAVSCDEGGYGIWTNSAQENEL